MKEMKSPNFPSMIFTSSYRFLRILAVLLLFCTILYFLISLTLLWTNSNFRDISAESKPVSLDRIVFGLACSSRTWLKQKEFLRLWWKPHKMRGCVFVDSLPLELINRTKHDANSDLPEVCVSEDTSRFRYTYKHGYHSFIRVARIVLETVRLTNHTAGEDNNVRWYVFGDADTVFIPENLVKTLSKYDHNLSYFVGSSSEVYELNKDNSFDMAFWGGGFALSAPLAKKLAMVFDSCLERYPHLYGSDGRVYACLAELGVGLTHEPGFHQVAVRGNIFGLLAAHPLTPLVSFAHLDEVDPIFPSKSVIESLQHLFKSVTIDPERTLQQTICYDRWFSWTISVSWGYAVEVFNQRINLHDALRVQETFFPWKKGATPNYVLDTRLVHPDPCRRSTVFFLNDVNLRGKKVMSKYRRTVLQNCTYDPMTSPKKLDEIVVFTWKSNIGINELRAPRRHCCDILPPTSTSRMEILIRECRDVELIKLHA